MERCPHCSKALNRTLWIGLSDSGKYYREFECLSCHKTFTVEYPLVQPETGEYIFIHSKLTGDVPLHQLIWQLAHPGVEITGIIHHINGYKRDNRPENLYMIERGHSAYLNKENKTVIIAKLKARIAELEKQLTQLKLV